MSEYLLLLLRLFAEFFKTGLFSIGGGLATLPFLSEMATKTGWFTQSQLADMVAVSESTPGPVGVNVATYVGYTVAGIPGGIISTLGLVTPSIIIIIIISGILKQFKDNNYIKSVFYFLRPTSTALIFMAFLSLVGMLESPGIISILFAVIIYILSNHVKYTKKLHPIIWILSGAVFGIIFL